MLVNFFDSINYRIVPKILGLHVAAGHRAIIPLGVRGGHSDKNPITVGDHVTDILVNCDRVALPWVNIKPAGGVTLGENFGTIQTEFAQTNKSYTLRHECSF